MPVPEQLARDPAVAGPLGSLLLSAVRPRASTLALRALRWQRDLLRLGVKMPLAVIHDLGLLLACPKEQLELGPRDAASRALATESGGPALHAHYLALIEQVSQSEAARRSRSLQMSDDVVVVLLARLLATISERVMVAPSYVTSVPLDAALVERLDEQLPELFGAVRRNYDFAALRALVAAELYVLTVADALDLDTLRLFGMLGGDAAQARSRRSISSARSQPRSERHRELLARDPAERARDQDAPGRGHECRARLLGPRAQGLHRQHGPDRARLGRSRARSAASPTTRSSTTRASRAATSASASTTSSSTPRPRCAATAQTFARGMAIATARSSCSRARTSRFASSTRASTSRTARAAGSCRPRTCSRSRASAGATRRASSPSSTRSLELLARPRSAPAGRAPLHARRALHPAESTVENDRQGEARRVFILPSGGKLDLDYLDLLDAHWVVDHKALATTTRERPRPGASWTTSALHPRRTWR